MWDSIQKKKFLFTTNIFAENVFCKEAPISFSRRHLGKHAVLWNTETLLSALLNPPGLEKNTIFLKVAFIKPEIIDVLLKVPVSYLRIVFPNGHAGIKKTKHI